MSNYLVGSALEFVKRHEDIDTIWDSLKKSFGDPRMMLMKKLQDLESVGHLWRIKDSEKAKDCLSKVVNVMDDLVKLAKDHQIEESLYNGDAIYTIYRALGDEKVDKFIDKTCDENLKGHALWQRLMEFLDKEIKISLES